MAAMNSIDREARKTGLVRQFLFEHGNDKLTPANVRQLVKLASGPDRKLGSDDKVKLGWAVARHPDLFTAEAMAELRKLTGLSPLARPTTLGGSGDVPSTWTRHTGARAADDLDHAKDKGDPLFFRTRRGATVPLDPASYAGLARAQAIEVLKNPREFQTADSKWEPSFHITLNGSGAMAPVASQLDRLVESGVRASQDLDKALAAFLEVTDGDRVNGMDGPPNLKQIKKEIRAALPKLTQALADFDAAHQTWKTQAAALERQPLEADARKLVRGVVEAAEPRNNPAVGIDLATARNVLKAFSVLIDRPEVSTIDPGETGLRINLDTEGYVRKGGHSMVGYVDALTRTLQKHGVEGPFEIERNDEIGKIQEDIIKHILAPALGKKAVLQAFNTDDDETAGSALQFEVAPEHLAAARALVPQIKQFLAPWAFSNYSKHIEFDAG